MNVTFYNVLKHTSAFSVLIPLLLCVIKYKSLNAISKIIFIYLAMCLVGESALFGYYWYTGKSNHWIFRIIGWLEFASLSVLFYRLIKMSNSVRVCYCLTIIIIYFIFVLEYIQNEGLYDPTPWFNALYFLFIIGCSIGYFYFYLKESEIIRFRGQDVFYIICGILLFFSVTFFVMLFENFINTADSSITRYVWSIVLVGNLFYNALISIGILKSKNSIS